MAEKALLPAWSSSLARGLDALPAHASRVFTVPPVALLFIDAAVTAASLLADEDDDRPWVVRLSDLSGHPVSSLSDDQVAPLFADVGALEPEELLRWIKRLRRPAYQVFLKRALGAALYERLRRALLADVAVVGVALRLLAKELHPYALAFQDLVALAQPELLDAIDLLDSTSGSLLAWCIRLDGVLENLVTAALDAEVTKAIVDDARPPTAEEIEAAIPALRELLRSRSLATLAGLGSSLERKVQGARDAITYSADPVSQAANSLIELVDRLLRAAFADGEVLAWADANYPGDARMRYVHGSTAVRPTKRAQALCFVNAGQPVTENRVFHEWFANALLAARDGLQDLKHADACTPEELTDLDRYFAGVDAFVTFTVRLLWATAPSEAITQLSARLNPQGAVVPATETA